jgi:hypothetical protein
MKLNLIPVTFPNGIMVHAIQDEKGRYILHRPSGSIQWFDDISLFFPIADKNFGYVKKTYKYYVSIAMIDQQWCIVDLNIMHVLGKFLSLTEAQNKMAEIAKSGITYNEKG